MPDPAWPSSPPEVNYLRLAGPGSAGAATTIASGAAWQTLAVSDELACALSVMNTAATAPEFEGVGGLRSAAAVTGLDTALQLLAGWAQEKPPLAASAAAAYQTAVSSMIPAEVSLANRAEQAADVALNPLVLGALTPAIVALDAAYFGEHWPHNASVGIAYGAALAGLVSALAVPPPIAPLGASPTAPLAAAEAVAQAAGQAAAGEAMKQSGQLAEQAARLPAAGADAGAALGQVAGAGAQPLQAFTGAAAGVVQPFTGMFGAPVPAPLSHDAFVPAMLSPGGGVGGAGMGASPGAGSSSVKLPGAGLTTYTRPPSGFESENSGRPAGVRTGPLSAELRGPGWSGSAVGPVSAPTSPVPPRTTDNRREAAQARPVIDATDGPDQVSHRVK